VKNAVLERPARSRPLAFGVALALFASLVAYLHIIRLVEPLGVDQGLFACFARWVPRGWLPYRDIFDSKPPLFLYSYALAALVPGDVVRAIWWVEGVWLLASLSVAYAVVARVWSRPAGLACAALLFFGLWSPAWGGFWSRAQAEELLALPMLGAAWFAWRAIDHQRFATLAGVLAGVCGLYKIPSLAIAGAFAFTWLLTLPRGAFARRAILLTCGVAVPWVIVSAWFAAQHALLDFATGVFVYHRYNAAFISPPWSDVFVGFTRTMVTRASFLLVAAALGLRSMVVHGERRALCWVAPWIAFTMAAVILQRQLADYHYLLVMPPLAVAGAYGLVASSRDARAAADPNDRWLAITGLVVLVALGAREAAAWVRAYAPDAQATTGALSREAYLRQIQMGNYSTADEEAAARYIDAHSGASEGILVWGLSPGLYAIADRHPVTRFPFHKILMTDAPLSRMWPGLEERRADFMARLAADPPSYILVGHGDRNGFEPQDSFTSMTRFAELRELIARSYREETQIGHFVVFHRVP
jgi:hypothetical protein